MLVSLKLLFEYVMVAPKCITPYGGIANWRPILLANKSVQPQAGVKLGGKGFSLSCGTSLAKIKASTSQSLTNPK